MNRLFTWILFALVLFAARAADAQDMRPDARRAGTVRLTTVTGGPGPVKLAPEREGYGAELLIVNDGKEPLVVSRISVRGEASDPRAPPKLSTRLVDASLPVAVPPGGSRKAAVFWAPDKTVRQKQLFAHVVVTTSDERAGEVAMGIRGQRSGGGGHLVAVLLGVPFIGALASIFLSGARASHRAATIALVAQTAVAAWMCIQFVPDITRADGNDGLQFVAHVVFSRVLPLEIHLGVDGIGAAALLTTSAVALLAIAADPVLPRSAHGYYGALLVLDAAAIGALVSMNGLVLVVFMAMAVAAFPLLVGVANRRAAAWRAMFSCGFGVLLVLVALIFIARSADPTFLADGTTAAWTFDLPDLSRVAFGDRVTLVGARTCFVLVAIASMIFLGAFPTHRWLSDVLIDAPPAAGILVVSAMPAIGLVTFLRIGCSLLPEGMRWASGVVVALGAVSTVYGAFEALGQRDLRRLAAASATSLSGCVLLGAGSLTPQGIGGAIVLGTTRGVAICAFLLLVAAMQDRTKTSQVDRLGGIGAHAPGLLTALGAASLGQAGLFGSCGAWGVLLALFGALSSYAPLALSVAVALVVLAVAHLAPLSHMVFGRIDPEWERSDVLEAHGGRVPDLRRREWSTVGPLLVAAIVLGMWPAPIMTITTGTVRDLANRVSPPGPDQVAFVR